MTRRRLLQTMLISLMLCGLAAVLFVFMRALSPPDFRSGPTFEIAVQDMAPGSGKLIVLQKSQRIETRRYTRFKTGQGFLVLKDHSGDYYLYWVPVWDDRILMPWRAWGQHEGTCDELQFGRTQSGESMLYCKNADWPEFLTRQWYWTFSGRNLGEELPDLTPVRFNILSGVMQGYWYWGFSAAGVTR